MKTGNIRIKKGRKGGVKNRFLYTLSKLADKKEENLCALPKITDFPKRGKKGLHQY